MRIFGWIILVLIFLSLMVLVIGSNADFWGSRGITEVYSFRCKEFSAVVQKNNLRLAQDRYWILLGGGQVEIYNGKVLTDDGHVVKVYSSGWDVKDAR